LYKLAFDRAKDALIINSWLLSDASTLNNELFNKMKKDITLLPAGVPRIYLKHDKDFTNWRDEDFTDSLVSQFTLHIWNPSLPILLVYVLPATLNHAKNLSPPPHFPVLQHSPFNANYRPQDTLHDELKKIGSPMMLPVDVELASRYRPLDIARKAQNLCVQFLAAEPDGMVRVGVGTEIREFEKAFKGSRSCCHKVSSSVTSKSFQSDIQDSFETMGAHIIHFAGHSEAGELFLEGGSVKYNENDEREVYTTDVAPALNVQAANPDSRLHGVVLNACNTDHLCKLIENSQGFVISTANKIVPETAVCFSGTLYSNLTKGRSLYHSFCVAVLQVYHSGDCLSSEAKDFKLYINQKKLGRIVKELEQ
jgi:hypothetical protein